ncbi:MAG: glycerol-3-phosphate acyltransferase [Chloroflexi bacterium]|nr:MAG: glycerol-3-phosphate acyltransferase [Chloroflexota bacterium]
MSGEERILRILITIVVSYLLGSLPTAYIIARLKNINIFEVGSGNMGGTNVVRTLGIGWGVFTAAVDIIKGASAVIISWFIMPDITTPAGWASATVIAGIVAVVGHNWSLLATLLTLTIRNGRIQATIRGGKGAATAFGTLIIIAPTNLVLAMVAIGGMIVAITRYVSLGVLTAYGVGLGGVIILVAEQKMHPAFIIYAVALSALMVIRFRSNIERLLTGKERRLGERA